MKPSMLFVYDREMKPWGHRLHSTPPYLLEQACKEFFEVFSQQEKKPNEVDLVLNALPLVTEGGIGTDLFACGKITFLWDRVPFEYVSSQYFSQCDWVFTSAPSYVSQYPQGKSSVLLDAIDEAYSYIPQIGGFEYDIVFLGNESGSVRKPLLDALEKHWKVLRFSGELGVPSAHLLSKGKLNLGIFDKAMEEGKTGIEYRTFLFGTVRPVMLHKTPDLEQAGFLPFVHFIPYQTTQEAIDVAKYFLDHDKEREDIGQTMKQVLHQQHTFHHRAKQIYDTFLKIT